jgi:hypothetical protein
MSEVAAVKRYKKAEIQAEKALTAAADALTQLHKTAADAGFYTKGADDGRLLLQSSCREYADFLNMRIERNL